MKYIYNLAFKMAVSATIALIIAELLNLDYATVAAVIAILSIQDTRKKALVIGKNRVLACLIGLALSIIIYNFIGHNSIGFGVFLIIFIPLTSKLKVEEGMIATVVLSTHLLVASNITLIMLKNELLLMFIGIGIASIANLFMPSLEDSFKDDREQIENSFRIIISRMSKSLITHSVDIYEQKLMDEIEENLKESKNRAYKIVNNNFFNRSSYYIDYINMRINQFDIIKKMRIHFEKFYMSFEQTKLIAEFTNNVAENITEDNDCKELMKKVLLLREEFKGMELPKSRDEFENRAQLLQFLNDIEEFLNLKRNFAITYIDNENKTLE
ncbi:aromatic acid exporter family protein [Clostridium gasigenes]|uniref:aromatic acid exporter family protein n=1 Tax=Clostridium gasigenes TaxID=94869 RepID=UPI001438565D|nr:aromatic acid exporter family protein [Clostridium gasigenes]NKF08428.1 aromatic acid exporter family protein [Clostridium gasigenes]QSW18608.1 aromatic acid exporter family protein [Clostridium gasigenes]